MKTLIRNSVFIFGTVLTSLFASCSKNETAPDYKELQNLPKDTGGIHSAVVYNSSVYPYGYYLYTPSGYEKNDAVYPLLVFLHGSGEKGNSMTDATVLKKVLANGPPKLINGKKWAPKYPMIVVSPQCHDSGWNPGKIHKLIAMIVQNYRINTGRIYLTGLSMGGYGTYSYVEAYADTGYVAAVVPVCGGGNTSKAKSYKNMPLWAFHGDADLTVLVSQSINMVNAINALSPVVKAKLTIYPGVAHDSWTRTYDSSGMGTEKSDYDPFNLTIYDWMFTFKKNLK